MIKRKGLLTITLLTLVTLAIAASYDRWFCSYCSMDMGTLDEISGPITFIRSTVNTVVNQWRPGDTVTITNGEKWTTFRYSGSPTQLWIPINFGDGEGPGELRNTEDVPSPTGGGGGLGRGSGGLSLPTFPSIGGGSLPIGRVDAGPIQIVSGGNGGGGGGSCNGCHN